MESAKAFAAFTEYLKQGPERSLTAVTQTVASWNQTLGWLQEANLLRAATPCKKTQPSWNLTWGWTVTRQSERRVHSTGWTDTLGIEP